MDKPKVEFDWEPDTSIDQMVANVVGAASMCWEHVEEAGVFDSSTAADIADQLIAALHAKSIGLNDGRDNLVEAMSDEIDRLRTGEVVLRRAVVATFHTIAEWGSVGVDGSVSRDDMREIAAQVETGKVEDWGMCPVCQEAECDDGCPLQPLRTRGT